MSKDEEVAKANERGKPLTNEQIALEDARDAFHGNPHDPAVQAAFQAAQQLVVSQRQSERQAREAAGPPADATNVQRDANGRAFGWNTAAGDAVTAPGGVS